MHTDAVCLESVVVAVDDAIHNDIEEIPPKISSCLESMSHPSISNAIDDNSKSHLNEVKIESIPLHIENSRNKLSNSCDADRIVAIIEASIDGDEDDTEENVGCYNQSFSKSESIASVQIDANDSNENEHISDDASIVSSSVQTSLTKPKDPDDKQHL